MNVRIQTVDSGTFDYQTLTISIDVCVITHLTPTNLPQNTAYTIFNPTPLAIDVSTPGFNQVPACGYYLFKTFTWDIPAGAKAITTNDSNSYAI